MFSLGAIAVAIFEQHDIENGKPDTKYASHMALIYAIIIESWGVRFCAPQTQFAWLFQCKLSQFAIVSAFVYIRSKYGVDKCILTEINSKLPVTTAILAVSFCCFN